MFPTFDNIPTPLSNNTIKNTESLTDLKKNDKNEKNEKTEKIEKTKVTNPYVNKYKSKKSHPISKEKKPLK
jgi:hypothetical protein